MVVHTGTEALLIKRADHDNFWQSVTGSLRWGESAQSAARRELQEETGIVGYQLRDTGISRSYEILAQWRDRYPPNVIRNREHLFYCCLDDKTTIELNPAEHTDQEWLHLQEASQRVFSWTNRLAIQGLL